MGLGVYQILSGSARGKTASLSSRPGKRSHPGKRGEARELNRFSHSLNWKCFALHHARLAKSHAYTHPTPTLTRGVCPERGKRGASGGRSSVSGPRSRTALVLGPPSPHPMDGYWAGLGCVLSHMAESWAPHPALHHQVLHSWMR